MILKLLPIFFFISFSLCSYDPAFGEKLCRLTVASYCNPKHVKEWSCGPCKDAPIKLEDVSPFTNSTGDVLGYIGVSNQPKAVYLVFRGTLPWDLKNWIEDINFINVKYPLCDNTCDVHRGFYHAYLEIAPQVERALVNIQAKHNISDVIVTGHSLGAALATHAAAHITKAGHKVIEFYNFGSPRVGNAKFSQWFDNIVKANTKARVTHSHDPVPHLPLHDWGFNHISHEIFYKGKKTDGYVSCSDTNVKEDSNCSDKNKMDVNVLDHCTYYDIDFTGIVMACQL